MFNSFWLIYREPIESHNLLSQVHNTYEFEATMTKIREEMDAFENGHGPRFLAKDGHTWPTTWYFFNRDEYKFHYQAKYLKHYKYVLTETNDKQAQESLKESHNYKDILYRSWYLPDYDHFSFSDFMGQWWNFNSDHELGEAKLRLYFKN